ncbi:MAG: transcription antitermination factor NusB [Desulfocapsaceae bacterium]|nr:transcription antitermination factor NusB [Desulfocapsaceae bacterium]
MGIRRKSRESALQFLFQDDFTAEDAVTGDLQERFDMFCDLYEVSRKARPYTLELLQGIFKNREHVDSLIRQCAKNWRLERIAITDRNLLRIGVFEMLYCDDVPDQVAINEAVEIAKRYGSDESPSFVNGILDAVKTRIQVSGDGSESPGP